MTPLDRVLDQLAKHGHTARRNGHHYQARCPAHDDRTPSLSITETPEHNILLYCHAGCPTPYVLQQLDLTYTDLYNTPRTPPQTTSQPTPTDIYPYHDTNGTLLYQVIRYTPKAFRQRQPAPNGQWQWDLQGIQRTLYRAPQIRYATRHGQAIWICEGEKDADNAEQWATQHGHTIVATTRSGGAIKRPDQWTDHYTQLLDGAHRIVIIADNDPTGHQHARIIYQALAPHHPNITIKTPAAPHKDLTDHINAGLHPTDLQTLDPNQPEPEPEPEPEPDPEPADTQHLDQILINWQDFWQTDTSSEEWLTWPLIAQGRGHSLYAPAKAGKSSLLLHLVATAATGQPCFGRQQPARHILYCDYEMSTADLYERLEELGYGPNTNLDRLHYALLPNIPPLDTTEGANRLIELAHHVHAELVVIDTFGRAVQGDENNADVVRAFYRLVGAPLKAAGIAWLRTDHAGKDLDRGQRGSSAKNDDVDVVWKLARQEGGVRVTRTHARMSWVPDKIDLTYRRDDDGLVRWDTNLTEVYPEGTKELAEEFAAHGIDHREGVNQIQRRLKELGIGKRRALVAAAVRWRTQETKHYYEMGTELRATYMNSHVWEPPSGTTHNEMTKPQVTGPGTTSGTTGNHLGATTGTTPPHVVWGGSQSLDDPNRQDDTTDRYETEIF